MGSWSATESDFGFGFDDSSFSDRVLCLHIIYALPSETSSEFGGTDFKLRKLHINSLVLASKSPFFFKLFKNGMNESQQKDEVTLKINASEELAFMDLLMFMYGITLSATSAPDLVDVLMAADKFDVPSCVSVCVDLLLKLPMSTESALVYLGLPSSILEGKLVQPLIDTVKKYLADCYKNFTKSKEELLGLPLCAIQTVLGSDGLEVYSEDAVLDFTLKWARLHYPELEERREILTKQLLRFICLPRISSLKIKEALDCSDFDYKELSKLVINALLSNDHRPVISAENENPRRVYMLLPIKVIQFHFTQPHCVVYLDIQKHQCATHHVSGLHSQLFSLGGLGFSLFVVRQLNELKFGLFGKVREDTETCILDFEFAVMKKSSKGFTSLFKASNNTVTSVRMGSVGIRRIDMFQTSWDELISEESEYFVDGILHIRADITLIS